MKLKYALFFAVFLPVQAVFAADAETPVENGNESLVAEAPVGLAEETKAHDQAQPTNTLGERQLPKLLLRWDCGECVHNEKVLPLIEQNYASDAAAQGYTISDSETAELAITAYRQRNPGVRVMFGVMAGKDILETRVTFRQKEFVAKDYYATAWKGMNGLCENVSKKVVSQIMSSLGNK